MNLSIFQIRNEKTKLKYEEKFNRTIKKIEKKNGGGA